TFGCFLLERVDRTSSPFTHVSASSKSCQDFLRHALSGFKRALHVTRMTPRRFASSKMHSPFGRTKNLRTFGESPWWKSHTVAAARVDLFVPNKIEIFLRILCLWPQMKRQALDHSFPSLIRRQCSQFICAARHRQNAQYPTRPVLRRSVITYIHRAWDRPDGPAELLLSPKRF